MLTAELNDILFSDRRRSLMAGNHNVRFCVLLDILVCYFNKSKSVSSFFGTFETILYSFILVINLFISEK